MKIKRPDGKVEYRMAPGNRFSWDQALTMKDTMGFQVTRDRQKGGPLLSKEAMETLFDNLMTYIGARMVAQAERDGAGRYLKTLNVMVTVGSEFEDPKVPELTPALRKH